MGAAVPGVATIEANRVFHAWFPGRMVRDPQTGITAECRRNHVEIINGQPVRGGLYDYGMLNDHATVVATPNTTKRRMWFEKILMRAKGWLEK